MKKFYPNLRSVQIKTGIWTVVIVIILIFGYLWLAGLLSGSSQYELKIAFPDIAGLEIGDKVMFRGMEIGRVKKIEAQKEQIILTAKVKRDITLTEGSQFLISDSSLMGSKALSILPGNGTKPLNINQLQQGNSPAGMMELIAKASSGVEELKKTLQLINSPQGLLFSSQKLIENADGTVNQIGIVAQDTKQELIVTINKIERLTSSLQEVVAENKEPIKKTVAESHIALQRLSETLDSLSVLSANLNVTAQTLKSKEGTVGLLLNDKQLYNKINGATENLNALIQDIKDNPQKYIKIRVF
ncbi:MAG: MlaD family protein [Candidatus Cloacimonas sp.]